MLGLSGGGDTDWPKIVGFPDTKAKLPTIIGFSFTRRRFVFGRTNKFVCRAFGSPEIKLFGFPGNFVLKPPLLCFLPIVIGLPPCGDVLGRLTLLGAVAVRSPEPGGLG